MHAAPVIPSRLPRTVMLDTCTLQEVATRSELREWFVQWLDVQDLTCYIAAVSLVELLGDADGLGGAKDQGVADRLRGLRELREKAWARLRAAATYDDAVRAELQQRQSCPVEDPVDPSLFDQMTCFEERQLPEMLSRAPTIAAYVATKKDTLFQSDRNLREHVQRVMHASGKHYEEVSAEVAFSEINGRRKLGAGNLIIDTAAEALLDGRVTPSQVEERLPHCPVLNCAAQLVWRANLANAAPRDDQLSPAQRHVIGLFRTKPEKKGGRGDWYDYHTAATAAACTMFITGDIGLFRRCDHIRRLGVSGINAYKAEDVIEGYTVGTD